MIDPYVIGFKSVGLNQIRHLDRAVIERIVGKLLWLARNVTIVQHEVLAGQWSGFYRFRVGDYRIIYSLDHDERLILIEAVGHRRDVYDD